MPSFHKWKILYFNQIDYKQTIEHFSIKKTRTFILPERSIMDYALVRRTISGNQNLLWQLGGENRTQHR